MLGRPKSESDPNRTGYTLRFQKELKEEIERIAKQEKRTINAQVKLALE